MWKKNVIYKLCLLALTAAGMLESLHAAPYHQTVGAVGGSSPTSVVLRHDGTVWVSGFMWNAIDGTPWAGAQRTTVPVQVANVANIKSIAIESQGVLGLTHSGDLYAWGDGNFGSGSFQSFQTPSLKMTGISSIQTSNGAIFAIDSADGSVWAWGKHGGYNLGIGGSLSTVYTPTKIPNLTNIVSIAAHGTGGAAVDSSGQLWSWGSNTLGHSGSGPQAYPALVPGVANAKEVAASQGAINGTMIVLLNEQGGIVKAWGNGSNGQLGAGESAPASTGTMIQSGVYQTTSGPAYTTGVTSVAGGPGGFFALLANGTVWGWGGTNAWRAAGKEAPFEAPYPDSVVKYCHQVSGAANVTEISTSSSLLIMRTAQGYVLTSSDTNYGAAGDGISHTRTTPVQVYGLRYIDSVFTGLESAYALSNGKVYGWGRYTADGTGSPSKFPVLAKTSPSQPLTGVVQVAGGSSHTLARTSNNHVYAWGLGYYGNLGLGTNVTSTHYAQPISGLTTAQDISAGDLTSFAVILNTNNVRVGRSWGDNTNGALASGNRTARYTPGPVYSASGTVLQGIKKISPGGSHALFLMNTGAVRGSGSASPAIGGIYTGADKLYASPVPNLTGVNDISAGGNHSLAIASGKVFSWGRNFEFNLGLGHNQEASGIHEVPGFSSFTSTEVPVLAAVRYGGGLVENALGEIKGFGSNGDGQLADGTFDDRPLASPTLLEDYKQISANGPIIGLKTDGTVWTWGSVTAGVPDPLLRQMALNLSNDPADADFDGTPDDWEAQYFGSITTYDGADDADGDGLSNVQEFLIGTAPNKADQDGDGFNDIADPKPDQYYNTPPALTIISGDNQFAEVNTFLSPLIVSVKDEEGRPYAGGSVTFTVTAGSALISESQTGSLTQALSAVTANDGTARIHCKLPAMEEPQIVVTATAGESSVSFRANASELPLTGQLMRLRAVDATVNASGFVTSWKDAFKTAPIASQGDASKQPEAIETPIGRLIRFDGQDSLEVTGMGDNVAINYGLGLTAFFVLRPTDANPTGLVFGSRGGNLVSTELSFGSAGSALHYRTRALGANTAPGLVRSRNLAVYTLVHQPNESVQWYRNGSPVGAPLTVKLPETVTRTSRIGMPVVQGDSLKGDLGELVIYKRAVTQAEREATEAHLMNAYSIRMVAPTVTAATTTPNVRIPNQASLSATIQDFVPPISVSWELLAGGDCPQQVSFTSPNSLDSAVAFTAGGTYRFRVTVDDGVNAAVSNDVTVVVDAPPLVNAGPDLVFSSGETAVINGSVTSDSLPNPPGITTELWTQSSGPVSVTFNPSNTATSEVVFPVAGTYVLQLSANDGGGASVTDQVTVTINSAEINPPNNFQARELEQRVRLSWDARVNAESYTVKRSLSPGGPYAVIAANITALTYQDTNVVNGTTYYYVINTTAKNSGTVSGDAEEVQATPRASFCGPLDVAFVIDDTGSMGGAIDNVKSEINNLLSKIDTASGGDYRLALLTSTDDTVNQRLAFSQNNGSAFNAALSAVVAQGGGDKPESTDQCIRTVVEDPNGFRPGAKKVIILVTDAVPGGFADAFTEGKSIPGTTEHEANRYTQKAAERCIQINCVAIGGGEPYPQQFMRIMRNYADVTGGAFNQAPSSGAGTGKAIIDMIDSCPPLGAALNCCGN